MTVIVSYFVYLSKGSEYSLHLWKHLLTKQKMTNNLSGHEIVFPDKLVAASMASSNHLSHDCLGSMQQADPGDWTATWLHVFETVCIRLMSAFPLDLLGSKLTMKRLRVSECL